MARTFAYCRVSTNGQTVENQIRQIQAAGFNVDPKRIVSETVSGASAIEQRRAFVKLLDRLEQDDTLVVTKMDRLGRSAMDVRATVERLTKAGVKVHCLQLNGTDLGSAAGKMIMGMLNTFAEFERDLLIERTQAGLERAKAQGKTLGRKPSLKPDQQADVMKRIAAGESVKAIAKTLKTSRMTIMRVRAAAAQPSITSIPARSAASA
jgi:putative DNA-invertase from lambdoid prophage Rac